MLRRLYFLPVRGNLGGAELLAAFAGQRRGDNVDNGDNGDNAIGATTINDAAAIEESAKAAVVVILTYAGFDIAKARGVLDALPECGGGVFCLVADVPAGAPFLPELRRRADKLRSNNNAVMIMELTAAAGRQQFDNAAAKVRAMMIDNAADDGNITGGTTMDENTTTAASGAGILGGHRQTPAEAVRAAHRAVEDLL